jgi:predicted enzyme related to lactoylglutathione lyase
MSERTSYEPGVPSWVDVSSPDVEASKRFYAGVFGWDALAGPVDETGGYAMFQRNGRTVAGLAPIQDENQPPMWSVYVATDVEGAKAFYAAVFDWQADDQEFGGTTYTMFNVGDVPVAGAMRTPSQVPDEVPAFWLSYFTVEDCDAAVAKVQELGGRTFGAPHSLEGVGRFAVVADPHGATFGVIAGEPPAE